MPLLFFCIGAKDWGHRHLVCGDTGHPAWCLEIVIGRRDAREPHRQDACAPLCFNRARRLLGLWRCGPLRDFEGDLAHAPISRTAVFHSGCGGFSR